MWSFSLLSLMVFPFLSKLCACPLSAASGLSHSPTSCMLFPSPVQHLFNVADTNPFFVKPLLKSLTETQRLRTPLYPPHTQRERTL